MNPRNFCLGMAFFLGAAPVVADSLRLLPPNSPHWNTLGVYAGNRKVGVLVLNFRMKGSSGKANKTRLPHGLLDIGEGLSEDYWRCRWRIAAGDRDDHFSVRWRGLWHPGDVTCEIRLQADDEAVFYLDGEEILACTGEVFSTTGRFRLDARYHRVRLDYEERTGRARVFLQWRISTGHSWLPLVPYSSRGGGKLGPPGWGAVYYLGEGFAEEAFRRRDREIAFDWGEGSPFDRDADIPSMQVEWMQDETGRLIGRIETTRSGELDLRFEPDPREEATWRLSGSMEPTGFSVKVPSSNLQFRLNFDQVAVSEPRGIRGAKNGYHEKCLRFPVEAGRPLRFWQEGAAAGDGAAVSLRITRRRRVHEEKRCSLEERLAPLDGVVMKLGRAWIHLLFHPLRAEPGGKGKSPDDGERMSGDGTLAGELLKAVSGYATLYAPDLLELIPSREAALEILRQKVLVRASMTERAALVSALSEWKQSLTTGADSSRPPIEPDRFPVVSSRTEWTPTTGLAAMVRGVAVLNGLLFLDSDGGVVIGNLKPPSQPVRIRNWTFRGRKLTLLFGPNGLNLSDSKDLFIRFSTPAVLWNFKIGKDLWRARVETVQPGFLETGPPERIEGVTWKGLPVPLMEQANVYRSSLLPSSSGELVLRRGERKARTISD